MKKTLIVIAISVIFLISEKISYAQIYTGNASVKSEVYNYVEGGDVETNIRVETNGEVKTLSTTESGAYKLEVRSSADNINPRVSQPAIPEISPVKEQIKTKEKKKTFLAALQNTWENFFQRLKSMFDFSNSLTNQN